LSTLIVFADDPGLCMWLCVLIASLFPGKYGSKQLSCQQIYISSIVFVNIYFIITVKILISVNIYVRSGDVATPSTIYILSNTLTG
jgi:hypothetical protein